ncbi:MAG TPA: DUF308 domain-containing protein [Pseudolysinimonas sp.]
MLDAWIISAGRAFLALALGLAITFTAGHTAAFGLVAFGAFAVASGLLLAAGSFGPRAEAISRTSFRAQAVVTVAAGIAALVLPGGGIGYLVWILSGWAIVAGALELVSGIRARGRAGAWTDWVTVGGLTVVLGAVVLIIPPDIADRFSGDKGVEGLLTSSIIIVGLLGGWAVVTGVLLAIAAASPKARSAVTAGKAGSTGGAS